MALTEVKQAGLDDEAVNESKLQISNAGTNGQYLQKQSGNTGGLTWADVPAGVGGATGVDFNDNVKIRSGTGNDLEIYHNGTLSRIDNNTGDLLIRTNVAADVGGNIYLKPHDDEDGIIITHDAGVELYYNGTKRFETNNSGAHCTGSLTADTVAVQDNEKFLAGNDDDLEIYHSGSHAYITNNTGWLISKSDNHQWTDKNGDVQFQALLNGKVQLYYDGDKRFETDSQSINVFGDEGESCHIYMSADQADDQPDQWRLKVDHAASSFYLQNYAGGDWNHTNLKANGGGSIELYHNNSKKLETDSFGVSIQGDCLKVPDGSAGSPGFTWNNEGNADTGIFRPGANEIAFTSAGTERLRIADNGHLFVGSNNGAFGNASTQFSSFKTNQANVYITTFRNEHDQGRGILIASGEAGDAGPHRSIFFEADDGSSLGSITHNGSASAFNTSSDYRLKQDIVSITDGITQIKKLTPRRFKWKNNTSLPLSDGFIAHEIQESGAINNIVVGAKDEKDGDGKDEYQTVDYAKLTPLLTAALKEAIAKIETLETKVAALEAA